MGKDEVVTDSTAAVTYKPRSTRRKIAITIALVIWFALLLLPCFFLTLAFNQEIVIPTGDLPGQYVRIWLVMEPFERGIGYSTASVQQSGGERACVTTSTGFLLWQGRGEPVSACECYERAAATADWSLVSVAPDACPADG